MRSKRRLLLILLMALLFFFLCIHQLSATSLGRVEKKRGRTVAQVNKFSHGSVGGGGDGGSGSHTPAGGGVTPLYAAAAGAGSNHHPHRGGGNCERGGAGPEILAIITFAWLISAMYYY